ncbi:hypothetical protein SAMN05216368_10859 [Cryobacterium flavum]|uniref:Uncharacterized protein n=1 Tax=Cryobacterium flavum TaxID=1424659 RepID=A0A5E9G1F9_9MICO|nr:hypothetical protein SAMN05216368_10859 [Cryobacterium flavum]
MGTAEAPHTDQASQECGAANIVRKIRATNMVDDDVDPAAIRQFQNPISETGLVNVDHVIGTLGTEQVSCPVRANGCDNRSSAQVFCQLYVLKTHR